MTHTPRPHEIRHGDGYADIAPGDGHGAVARVFLRETKTNNVAEKEANARLFAAAPALLEALEAADQFDWVHNAGITNDIEALRKICLQYSDWWNNTAMPVIAKAKESP